MHTRNTIIITPVVDRRTREARIVADTRRDLEQRLGGQPSVEQRQLAEQIIRTRLEIARIERKRENSAPLSEVEAERSIRLENMLSRSLRRFERIAPAGADNVLTLAQLATAKGASHSAHAAAAR